MSTLNFAIKAAIPHASKDKTVPVLNTVLIRPSDVLATDRYTMVKSSHDLTDHNIPDDGVLIRTDDAKRLTRETISQVTVLDGVVTFVTHGGSITVPVADGIWTNVSAPYPAVERLIPERSDEPMPSLPPFGLNPSYLERLAYRHVKRDRHEGRSAWRVQVTVNRNGGIGPVRFDFADHTTAVIMPARV